MNYEYPEADGIRLDALIGFCGLECGACEAYQASRTVSLSGLEEVAIRWRVQYHSCAITAASVHCDGCQAGKRVAITCAGCAVRRCALHRGLASCAICPDYACATLGRMLGEIPGLLSSLEAVRGSL